jgi:hypothetical protein
MAQVPEKVLSWLYRVLHVCAFLQKHTRHTLTPISGISRSTKNLLRCCSDSHSLSFTQPSNRSLQLRQRELGASFNTCQHHPSELSRDGLQVSNSTMDTTVVPARASNGICHTWARYGYKTWPARRRGWKNISSIFGRLE